MKLIPLTKGHFAKVDDEDFERLSKWDWYYSHGYAVRSIGEWPNQTHVWMHHEILDQSPGMETDHENSDGCDNQRPNLRLCTHSQNNANASKRKDNTSGYKGVSWYEPGKKWHARITKNGRISLGYFKDPIEAAHAYDDAALKLYGKFAKLNFPKEEIP